MENHQALQKLHQIMEFGKAGASKKQSQGDHTTGGEQSQQGRNKKGGASRDSRKGGASTGQQGSGVVRGKKGAVSGRKRGAQEAAAENLSSEPPSVQKRGRKKGGEGAGKRAASSEPKQKRRNTDAFFDAVADRALQVR